MTAGRLGKNWAISEKAVSDYKEALQANPNYDPAKANLQRLGK